ncbi:MAG: DUF362 domain-containing protein [Candidatus Solibacter sp.]|nr:DUF362 domain-containing protein [Candidatus Solibacter sp.]
MRKTLSLVLGLAALAWFLIRVIPKPSRAAYPCQRAAFPLASGFVIWLAGLFCLKRLHRRAVTMARRSPYAIGGLAVALVVLAAWLPLGVTSDAIGQGRGATAEPFRPSEPPNTPMGEGKGIHPGRVAWVRDPDATSWDGVNGKWWDDAHTDAAVVDGMTSTVLQSLTGEKSDKQAWDALFRHFNRTRQLGNSAYRRGEKIAIKINANQDRSAEWGTGGRPLNGLPSPQVVSSLVAQLITLAGVPGEDITIYEVAGGRNIGPPIYSRIRSGPQSGFQAVRFVVGEDFGLGGRVAPIADDGNPVRFSLSGTPVAYLPKQVTEAKYMINLALLRPHGMAGVTLIGKNHFGSLYFPKDGGWTPRPLHNLVMRTQAMGSYNPLVDLLGHRHLGGKTLLFLLDGLYSAEHNEGNVMRFASFGNDWASSLLASQDPVALDSVGVDILRNEPNATQVRGNVDNYLHEAALAAKPPSGIAYDPDGSGKRLASLGVHEHWNNAAERKYSRNLGRQEGIELSATLRNGAGK